MFKQIFFLFLKNKNFIGELKVHIDQQELKFGRNLFDTEINKLVDNAEIIITDKKFFQQVILNGDIGLGEAFFKGYFETSDLNKLLKWFVQNSDQLPSFRTSKKAFILFEWRKIFLKIAHLRNRNTKEGSKKNIKEHYDISNHFYELWLDSTMTYSSAVFQGEETLEEAQNNKYRKICEKLKLQKTDSLLEIGSGWGGFAKFAVNNYGCKITSITVSENQFDYVKKMIKTESLEDKIDIRFLDYRDLQGTYNKIVSIEMMEALGNEFVPVFLEKCLSLLQGDGRMCLQCITYPDKDFELYQKNNDYIKKYIFPGGELLSLNNIKKIVQDSQAMTISSLESIGQDYAKTLRIWRKNFEAKKEEIVGLGFDEEFFKKWLYYFVYCEVGFETAYIDNYQILISCEK